MKIINNLILTLCFSFFTIVPQVVFYWFHDSLTLEIPMTTYSGLVLFLLVFSFIRNPIWRYISMSFVLMLSLFQMVHLEFYGLPVFPAEIWLLFTQVSEITGTLKEDIYIFLRPFLLVFPGLIILWKVNKLYPPKISAPYLHFIFIFYFIYNPTRTYLTGNTWGRQPSNQEFDGMNIYLSLSYFLGKIVPNKITGKSLEEPDIQITFKKTPVEDRNIIFIIGESQTPFQMGLFGYKRDTTPYLDSLKENKDFFYTTGISSGVSTDISLAFIINNTFGLGGAARVVKSDRCLFKLAKNNKFKTFFYSAQSSQQLRYIINSLCPKYIDDYRSFSDITKATNDENAANDHDLLDQLENINFTSGKNFIVLHHRGSHSPISLRFTEESHIFKNSIEDVGKTAIINNYDNSTFHLDLFFKKLFKKIDKYTNTIVIYASDHGEGVGQNDIWGHGMLKKISMDIPIIGYSKNEQFRKKFDKFESIPNHLNITLLLSNLLGYETSVPFSQGFKYRVLGNDINGFAGWADIIPKDGNYVLKVHYY